MLKKCLAIVLVLSMMLSTFTIVSAQEVTEDEYTMELLPVADACVKLVGNPAFTQMNGSTGTSVDCWPAYPYAVFRYETSSIPNSVKSVAMDLSFMTSYAGEMTFKVFEYGTTMDDGTLWTDDIANNNNNTDIGLPDCVDVTNATCIASAKFVGDGKWNTKTVSIPIDTEYFSGKENVAFLVHVDYVEPNGLVTRIFTREFAGSSTVLPKLRVEYTATTYSMELIPDADACVKLVGNPAFTQMNSSTGTSVDCWPAYPYAVFRYETSSIPISVKSVAMDLSFMTSYAGEMTFKVFEYGTTMDDGTLWTDDIANNNNNTDIGLPDCVDVTNATCIASAKFVGDGKWNTKTVSIPIDTEYFSGKENVAFLVHVDYVEPNGLVTRIFTREFAGSSTVLPKLRVEYTATTYSMELIPDADACVKLVGNPAFTQMNSSTGTSVDCWPAYPYAVFRYETSSIPISVKSVAMDLSFMTSYAGEMTFKVFEYGTTMDDGTLWTDDIANNNNNTDIGLPDCVDVTNETCIASAKFVGDGKWNMKTVSIPINAEYFSGKENVAFLVHVDYVEPNGLVTRIFTREFAGSSTVLPKLRVGYTVTTHSAVKSPVADARVTVTGPYASSFSSFSSGTATSLDTYPVGPHMILRYDASNVLGKVSSASLELSFRTSQAGEMTFNVYEYGTTMTDGTLWTDNNTSGARGPDCVKLGFDTLLATKKFTSSGIWNKLQTVEIDLPTQYLSDNISLFVHVDYGKYDGESYYLTRFSSREDANGSGAKLKLIYELGLEKGKTKEFSIFDNFTANNCTDSSGVTLGECISGTNTPNSYVKWENVYFGETERILDVSVEYATTSELSGGLITLYVDSIDEENIIAQIVAENRYGINWDSTKVEMAPMTKFPTGVRDIYMTVTSSDYAATGEVNTDIHKIKFLADLHNDECRTYTKKISKYNTVTKNNEPYMLQTTLTFANADENLNNAVFIMAGYDADMNLVGIDLVPFDTVVGYNSAIAEIPFSCISGDNTDYTVKGFLWDGNACSPVLKSLVLKEISNYTPTLYPLEVTKDTSEEPVSILCLGDSITYGLNTSPKVSYHNYWGENYNITSINAGVSGATVSTASDNDTVHTYDSFIKRLHSLDTSADMVFIMGGTNDSIRNVRMGDFNGTDVTTFYGAYNTVINSLKNDFPNKTIVLSTPLYYGSRVSGSERVKNYGAAVKAIGKKYNLPVIDMQVEEMDCSKKDTAFMPDQLHPHNYYHSLIGDYILDEMFEMGILKEVN